MKHLKKLAALLLAVVMTMAISMTAFADETVTATPTPTPTANTTTYTLTLTGTTTGHIYEAYQIFTGDLYGTTLSNIKWGSGVKDTDNLVAALKADATLKGTFSKVTDAASVAEALSNAKKDDAVAQAFATVVSQYLSTTKATKDSAADKTEISDLTAGYYLVKDKDNSIDSTKKDAYTRFILEVVANTSAAVKSDVPTVEKKVKDTNDSDGTTTDWQDSADYDIGDSVPYQITGSMPSTIADYTTYKYVFTDKMSKGLTYTAKLATITVGGKGVTVGDKNDTGKDFTETVTANDDGTTTVTWACTDLQAVAKAYGITLDKNTKVVVTYNATLNDNAVVGSAGNPNWVDLTYSNNPNKGGEGKTGKTPDDTNVVFTYKTVVNKVDQNKKSLKGAAFKLEKKLSDGTYKEVKSFTAGEETKFEFTGLDDGNYRLTETTTPAGYNTIKPIEFTISAEHDVKSDAPTLTKLSGNATSGEATFTAKVSEGSLTTDVVNKKGSTLPSTGGRGTTMIYIIGAALVVMAGVVLAMRKKMSSKES
jgi:fimbrial isopeptide formation D2 family protein/LPXTG-motif cell wall-anchored protein